MNNLPITGTTYTNIGLNVSNYTELQRYYNVNDDYVCYTTSVTGTYNITFSWNFPSATGALLYGYQELDASLFVNFDNDTYKPTEGSFVFSNPSCVGLVPGGISAYVYNLGGASNTTETLDPSYVRAAYNFRTGIRVDGNYMPYPFSSTVSYTVTVPFTLVLRVPENNDQLLNKELLSDILSAQLEVSVAVNNIMNGGSYTGLNTINTSLNNIRKETQEIQAGQSEQLEATKEQTEKQGGFFKSVLDWFTGFPQMMVHIVVPTSDEMGEALDQLLAMLKSHLGFLTLPLDLLDRFFEACSVDYEDPVMTFPGFTVMGHVVWADYVVHLDDVFSSWATILSMLKITGKTLVVGWILILFRKKLAEILEMQSEIFEEG